MKASCNCGLRIGEDIHSSDREQVEHQQAPRLTWLFTMADGVPHYDSIADTATMFDLVNSAKGSTTSTAAIVNATQKHIVRRKQVLLQSIDWLKRHNFVYQGLAAAALRLRRLFDVNIT